jgi:anti-sigma factor RsiW
VPDRPDHPDREQLAAFQAGDGERRQRSEVEAHLAGCPSCAEVVASVRRARSGLALLEEPALPPGLHDRLAAALEAEAAQAPADLTSTRRRRATHTPGARARPTGRGDGQATPGDRPAARRDREAGPEILRPTPWYRRPVAWGAAAALLLAALVVPFLDRSGTMTSADHDAGGRAALEGQTEAGGGSAQLPVIRIPGEVTAAKVKASLAADRQARAALDAASGAPAGPAAAPGERLSPDSGGQDTARSSTPAPQGTPAPQADAALLTSCLPAATAVADPTTRPLTPAFFVEGTYQGRNATILVTTSASPPGRVDLWVFPRNNCSAPPLATERVR